MRSLKRGSIGAFNLMLSAVVVFWPMGVAQAQDEVEPEPTQTDIEAAEMPEETEAEPVQEDADDAATGQSASELAQQTQNPIADLISLPLQNNMSGGVGPHNRIHNVLNIQPVIPFALGSSLNLITRTILPVVWQPDVLSTDGGTFGLGDLNTTLFLAPAQDSGFMWGLGPIFAFPTATDDVLGTGKWSIGPSAVILATPSPWVIGVLINNIWSVGGDSSRADVNQMLIQYFINYNLSDGWFLTMAPIITANWEAPSGDQWIVPFGGGVGKLIFLGPLPVNTTAQFYWNVIRPDTVTAPDWTLRLQIQFLFPK